MQTTKLKSTLLILLFLSILSTRAQESKHLFNGEDLDGWYAYTPQDGKFKESTHCFKVEDQMIRLYGKKVGYLMSNEVFKNFTLTAEFRWNTDTTYISRSQKMNSGLMYLIPSGYEDALWPQGVQFQIKRGFTGDFIFLKNVTAEVNGIRSTPGKSVVINRTADAELAIGQWNTITITHHNGHIRQELNGKLVNKGEGCSTSEGHILLQYEGFPIDFRNIIITPQ